MLNVKTEIVIDIAEVSEKVDRLLKARTEFFDAARYLERWYVGDMISVLIAGNYPEKRNADEDVATNIKTEIVVDIAEVNEKVDRLIKARDDFYKAAKELQNCYLGEMLVVRIIDKKDETASGN